MFVARVVALLFTLACAGCHGSSAEVVQPVHVSSTPADVGVAATAVAARLVPLKVLRRLPHDADAFTQGLLWSHGTLFESTGRYGHSTLRRVEFPSGKVLEERALESETFAEGLAQVDDRLIQLQWKSGVAVEWNAKTMRRVREFRYTGEGWGLCYDGKSLAMSNGSSRLTFRDPNTFEITREVEVRSNGRPVRMLNELECVGPWIYANVWTTDHILVIEAASGNVVHQVDASKLLTPDESRGVDVLNGIAYMPTTKTFLITGKLWPAMFEVQLPLPKGAP